MPAISPGKLDPQPTRLKIEIVVDDDELTRSKGELSQKTFHRRARTIHPVEETGQLDQFSPQSPRASLCSTSW